MTKEFFVLFTEDDVALLTETGDYLGFEIEKEQGRGGALKPPRRYSAEIFEEDESVLMLLGVM